MHEQFFAMLFIFVSKLRWSFEFVEVLMGGLYAIYGTANNCMQENASNSVFTHNSSVYSATTYLCV